MNTEIKQFSLMMFVFFTIKRTMHQMHHSDMPRFTCMHTRTKNDFYVRHAIKCIENNQTKTNSRTIQINTHCPNQKKPNKHITQTKNINHQIHVSSGKLYASSAFFTPGLHPTVEDQVELARRISSSLSDANNKLSKGQTMYVNRKKRSVKWVHEGEGISFHLLCHN